MTSQAVTCCDNGVSILFNAKKLVKNLYHWNNVANIIYAANIIQLSNLIFFEKFKSGPEQLDDTMN